MKTRKFLSLALALIMVFAMIPVASLAENIDGLVNEAAAMRKLDNAWACLLYTSSATSAAEYFGVISE